MNTQNENETPATDLTEGQKAVAQDISEAVVKDAIETVKQDIEKQAELWVKAALQEERQRWWRQFTFGYWRTRLNNAPVPLYLVGMAAIALLLFNNGEHAIKYFQDSVHFTIDTPRVIDGELQGEKFIDRTKSAVTSIAQDAQNSDDNPIMQLINNSLRHRPQMVFQGLQVFGARKLVGGFDLGCMYVINELQTVINRQRTIIETLQSISADENTTAIYNVTDEHWRELPSLNGCANGTFVEERESLDVPFRARLRINNMADDDVTLVVHVSRQVQPRPAEENEGEPNELSDFEPKKTGGSTDGLTFEYTWMDPDFGEDNTYPIPIGKGGFQSQGHGFIAVPLTKFVEKYVKASADFDNRFSRYHTFTVKWDGRQRIDHELFSREIIIVRAYVFVNSPS